MIVKCQMHGDRTEDSHSVELSNEQMRMVIYAYGAGIGQIVSHGQIKPLCLTHILDNIRMVWGTEYKARRHNFYPHFAGDDEFPEVDPPNQDVMPINTETE